MSSSTPSVVIQIVLAAHVIVPTHVLAAPIIVHVVVHMILIIHENHPIIPRTLGMLLVMDTIQPRSRKSEAMLKGQKRKHPIMGVTLVEPLKYGGLSIVSLISEGQKTIIDGIDGVHPRSAPQKRHTNKDNPENIPGCRYEDDNPGAGPGSPSSGSINLSSTGTGFGSLTGSNSGSYSLEGTDQGNSDSQSGHQYCGSVWSLSDNSENEQDSIDDYNQGILNKEISQLYKSLKHLLPYPIDALLLYILQKSDATSALVHHDDIYSLLEGDWVIGSTEEFVTLLETLNPPISIKHGVGSIISSSESSLALEIPLPQMAAQQQPPNVQCPPTMPPQQVQGTAFTIIPRQLFDQQFKTFMESKGMTIDSRELIINTKQIDLYNLWIFVLQCGGINIINQHSLWPVIGGQLGFVQFPSSPSEPARSGLQVAAAVQIIYSKYLMQWEHTYSTRMKQLERRKLAMTQNPGSPGGMAVPILQQQKLSPQQQGINSLHSRLMAIHLCSESPALATRQQVQEQQEQEQQELQEQRQQLQEQQQQLQEQQQELQEQQQELQEQQQQLQEQQQELQEQQQQFQQQLQEQQQELQGQQQQFQQQLQQQQQLLLLLQQQLQQGSMQPSLHLQVMPPPHELIALSHLSPEELHVKGIPPEQYEVIQKFRQQQSQHSTQSEQLFVNLMQDDTCTASGTTSARIRRTGPIAEELGKQQQQRMDTYHDVQSFLTQAAEDFLASSTVNAGVEREVKSESEGLPSGYPPMYEISDNLMGASVGSDSGAGPSSFSKTADQTGLDRLSFYSFSQREHEEPIASSNSKLDPLDPAHYSSANLSPKSAAETPKGGHVVIDGNRRTRLDSQASPV
ncbi:hypothetical protein M422DRAFT_265632 [Sphaerobolus stellatus SS14]|uniref:ARID domain-containing protein n=1 Tax=Sphaerobolus stellatus (strain SS14) TaxID=990650 RepID=A0A0C9TQQ9_SPHS4|nr:hypothetical protein M422DRAFT_265632 [Sphaerobolus stellatus SS14]